jgi:hypothetical protein
VERGNPVSLPIRESETARHTDGDAGIEMVEKANAVL